MAVRVWALAAALLSAFLLVLVARATLTLDGVVRPTVSASTKDPALSRGHEDTSRATVEAVLAQRTRLQNEASVADGVRSESIGSEGARISLASGSPPPGLVAEWLQRPPSQSEPRLQKPQIRSGISSLPYREAQVLVQPQGRDFRQARNDRIRYGGGWLIFGVCLALALFLLGRGRIPLAEGESGEQVLRFNAFERATHWMTASAFLFMALTGLIILYGKSLILPWMGAAAFGALASGSAWLHMASAIPFALGIVVMIAMWTWGNLPERRDWQWLKRFGGFLRNDGRNPPAGRFNAGQKLVFWTVVLGGAGMMATGAALMLPFVAFGYTGMQWMQLLHAGIGLAMIALIIGHIYIGSVGMVGAFQAMWTGLVDRNWAREHHSVWLERLQRRDR